MSVPINELLPLGVFSASLVGSGHCAGMCGPFTLMFPGERTALAAYHGARGLAYGAFGALAGAFGGLLFRSPVYRVLPWIGTFFFFLYFSWLFYQLWTGKIWHPPIPKSWSAKLLSQSSLFRRPSGKAGAIGFASVFLPCGWLYSFLIAAVGLHSAWQGALYLLVFWLGTIPALSLGSAIRRLAKGRRIPVRVSAGILLLIGLLATGLKLRPLWLARELPSTCRQP